MHRASPAVHGEREYRRSRGEGRPRSPASFEEEETENSAGWGVVVKLDGLLHVKGMTLSIETLVLKRCQKGREQ
ncbi:hypothetical protein H920_12242 [Fukomys damarensis]|uniref:Uncharacterized protein n=1 Tax=Fukomys damarensis TaxID=885580 RepID=A0A091D2M8_FUKDA|nr:hypothetical protein H920_12242 [Fukomys damarensis]